MTLEPNCHERAHVSLRDTPNTWIDWTDRFDPRFGRVSISIELCGRRVALGSRDTDQPLRLTAGRYVLDPLPVPAGIHGGVSARPDPALRRTLDAPDGGAALGHAGRERAAQEFSVEVMARRYRDLYDDLL